MASGSNQEEEDPPVDLRSNMPLDLRSNKYLALGEDLVEHLPGVAAREVRERVGRVHPAVVLCQG